MPRLFVDSKYTPDSALHETVVDREAIGENHIRHVRRLRLTAEAAGALVTHKNKAFQAVTLIARISVSLDVDTLSVEFERPLRVGKVRRFSIRLELIKADASVAVT
jgi:hypothetical protein